MKKIILFSVIIACIFTFSNIDAIQSSSMSHKELINQIVRLAKKGRVLDCKVIAESTKDEVLKELGKPDKDDCDNEGGELFYTKKGLRFLYINVHSMSLIAGIYKTNKAIRELTLKELKKEIKDLYIVGDLAKVGVNNEYLLSFELESEPKNINNPKVNEVIVQRY